MLSVLIRNEWKQPINEYQWGLLIDSTDILKGSDAKVWVESIKSVFLFFSLFYLLKKIFFNVMLVII